MRWRFIELETRDACFNMAIDQAVMEGVANGLSEPTIRFYRWLPSAVSIGRFQSMKDEVDISRCNELGVSYVRRITGGGAVYHDYEGEVTYSVIAPEGCFPKGIRESYAFICNWVVSGLSNIGIKAEFVPINDIIADKKKISGNAQTRRLGVLLQHGTVLYNLETAKMFSLLKISKEKISDKLIKSVEERVTCVSRYSNITQEGLYKELMGSFADGKDYHVGSYTETESKRAGELARTVYGSDGWNFSR
jgi:lipoate-protein ligase A